MSVDAKVAELMLDVIGAVNAARNSELAILSGRQPDPSDNVVSALNGVRVALTAAMTPPAEPAQAQGEDAGWWMAHPDEYKATPSPTPSAPYATPQAAASVELPPLPEPIGEIVGRRLDPAGTAEFWGYFSKDYAHWRKEQAYTADQMRAYGRLCAGIGAPATTGDKHDE